jgi:hypothetical protein
MALPGQVMGSITLPILNMAPYAVPISSSPLQGSPMAVNLAHHSSSHAIGQTAGQGTAMRLGGSTALLSEALPGASPGVLAFMDPGFTQMALSRAQQSAQAVAARQQGLLAQLQAEALPAQVQQQQLASARGSDSHIGTTTHAGGGSGLQRMECSTDEHTSPGAPMNSAMLHCPCVGRWALVGADCRFPCLGVRMPPGAAREWAEWSGG